MKKNFILLLFFILISVFFKIPKYVELNNLAIIEGIGINYNHNYYTLYLKEVIPTKDNLGISYKYKYYKEDGKTIRKALNKLEQTTKKKLYLNKVKFLITNKKTSSKIITDLKLNIKYIYHTKNNIYKKLKQTNLH